MSKIGKTPIDIPKGVNVEIEKNHICIKGVKGELKVRQINGVDVKEKDGQIIVNLRDEKINNGKAYWGLTRALINNAIVGVSQGYSKVLELIGVGYRVEMQNNDLKLLVGYSHPVIIKAPDGITFQVEGNTIIKINGYNKQVVGQISAKIRSVRPPEPYKGKGIKYKDEIVRRKQGKSA